MIETTTSYNDVINNAERIVDLYGTITPIESDPIEFTVSDIIGGGKFKIKRRMNGGSGIALGGVYPSELSATIKLGAGLKLGGAEINATFAVLNGEEWQTTPLGVFYIDGKSIERIKEKVSFRATDALLKFDVAPSNMPGKSKLWEVVQAACLQVGLDCDTDHIKTLPNSNVIISLTTTTFSQVQTLRDLLSWSAQLMGGFAYMKRNNILSIRQITQNSEISIPHTIRTTSTKFSDDTMQITELTMRRGGGGAKSSVAVSGSVNMGLELPENPIISDYEDEVVSNWLKNILDGLSQVKITAFETTINGNPAIEIGDNLHLNSGGNIDIDNGVHSIITAYDWVFRGNHNLRCEPISSVMKPVSELSASPQIQVKSQTEKRIDGLSVTSGQIAVKTGTNIQRIITEFRTDLLTVSYHAFRDLYVVYMATMKFDVTKEGTIIFELIVDGSVVNKYVEIYAEGNHFRSINYPIVSISGQHHIRLSISGSAEAVFKSQESWATALAQGVATETPWDGTIFVSETIPPIAVNTTDIFIMPISDNFILNTSSPRGKSIGENIPLIGIQTTAINILPINDRVTYPATIMYAKYVDDTTVILVFSNPISVETATGLQMQGGIIGNLQPVDIVSVSADNTIVTVTVVGFDEFDTEFLVAYDGTGDLKDVYADEPISAFTFNFSKPKTLIKEV